MKFFRKKNTSKHTIFGKHTYGKPKIKSWGEGAKCTIGSYCSIANDVTIFLGGNHRTDWVSTFPFMDFPEKFPTAKHLKGHPATRGDVTIGHDVWIGSGTLILSGVSIGNGAVIAARSVVTKNVPAYTIVGGNPAKVIRKRFAEGQIDALENIAWWDWDEQYLKDLIPELCSENIETFIRHAQKLQNKSVYQP